MGVVKSLTVNRQPLSEKMIFDLSMIREFYKTFPERVDAAKAKLNRPLTLAEKILYAHLHSESPLQEYKRGKDYVFFQVDRVAMQDATAQMALLQFMTCGRDEVAVPSTVHCDHLITAEVGAEKDMVSAMEKNKEVFDFLSSVSQKYGIGFWKTRSRDYPPDRSGKLCLSGRYDDRYGFAYG